MGTDSRPPLPELLKAPPVPRSRNLVFTSAGDRSNLRGWLEGSRDFDLWVVYYGDRPGAFRDAADYYAARKGSKFQNLHYCYQHWQPLLARYDAIMVLDDDIVINATSLSGLFRIRRELDLWALQPAFRLVGKISWDITRVRPEAKLRYTNFIEMACPLLRRDKLDAFMRVYDPQLVGYGTDWWLLHSLGPDLENHVAIVDEITCINPFDRSKGGGREIDRVQSQARRQEAWERIKALHGLDEQGRQHIEYRRIPRSTLGALGSAIGHIPDRVRYHARSLASRVAHGVLPRRGPRASA